MLALVFCLTAAPQMPAMERGNDSVRPFSRIVTHGGVAYFAAAAGDVATRADLWRSDGTAAGTRPITAFEEDALVMPFLGRGGVSFLVYKDPMLELWSIDPRTEEPRLETVLGALGASVVQANGFAYLALTPRDSNTAQLWRSDGTAAGTVVIATIPRRSDDFTTDGRLLFFSGDRTLWRSDGTTAGTFSLDVALSQYATDLIEGGAAEGHLSFALDGNWWISDGTRSGTRLFIPREIPTGVAALNGTAYVTTSARNLYAIVESRPEFVLALPEAPRHLVATGGRLYFLSGSSSLWTTDGTPEELRLVKPLVSDYITQMTAAGDLLYVTVVAGKERRLWRSDGTSGGTFPVVAAVGLWQIASLDNAGRVVFFANDGVHGVEPWTSDGTVAGTRIIANLNPEGVLRGRVFDAESGAPVEAHVFVRKVAEKVYERGELFVRTGDDGGFVVDGLRDGTYTVSVRSAAGMHMPLTWRDRECETCDGDLIVVTQGSVTDLDLPLRPAARVIGMVRHAGQTEIEIIDAEGRIVTRAFTDPNGYYKTTQPIPPGDTYFARARAAGYSTMVWENVTCETGCDPVRQGRPFQLRGGQTTIVNFTMKPWGSVGGRIVDALTGKPIASTARVTARPIGAAQGAIVPATAVNGEYKLTLPDGRYSIVVIPRADEYRPAVYPGEPCADAQCSAPTGTPVSMTAGTHTPGYDIRVMPVAARITGRVVDAATGAPLAGIAVRVFRSDGKLAEVVHSREDGTYETPPSLRAGTYEVKAQPLSTYVDLAPPRSITVRGTDIVSGVDFALERLNTISGAVIDAKTRQPLPAIVVTISDRAGVVVANGETDAQGRYRLEVAGGRFTMHVQKRGWHPGIAKFRLDMPGSESRKDFALDPECAVTAAPSEVRVPAAGGEQPLTIAAPCRVCALIDVPHITLRNSCSANVTLMVLPNDGPPRRDLVLLPGLVVPVVQEGTP